MKLLSRRKTLVLLLSLAAIIALGVLATGITGMTFSQPNGAFDDIFVLMRGQPGAANAESSFWGRAIYWILMLTVFLLFLGSPRPQAGKNLIRQVVRITAIFLAAMIFMGAWGRRNGLFDPDQTNASQDGTPVPGSAQAVEFQPPTISSNLEILIIAVLALALAVLGIFLYVRFAARFRKPKPPLDEFAQAARAALDEISAGEKWENVIVRCYARMSAEVSAQRGLERDASMTPSEFVLHLERAGLPAQAVGQLTSLFERVRYGSHQAGQVEIEAARTCLNNILQACESGA